MRQQPTYHTYSTKVMWVVSQSLASWASNEQKTDSVHIKAPCGSWWNSADSNLISKLMTCHVRKHFGRCNFQRREAMKAFSQYFTSWASAERECQVFVPMVECLGAGENRSYQELESDFCSTSEQPPTMHLLITWPFLGNLLQGLILEKLMFGM